MSGVVALDAAVSDTVELKSVVFRVVTASGVATEIGSATATLDGWVLHWNSESVPNGPYSLRSLATDIDGKVIASPRITVLVRN